MDGIERIKALAADIKDEQTLQIINYLLSREDMNEKYLNEEKSLKQMLEFIGQEVRKKCTPVNIASGVRMAYTSDEYVYGLAIHYFDESNEDLKLKTVKTKTPKEELTEEVEETNTTEEKATTKVEKVESKKKSTRKEWISEGQLSLFDVM